MHLSKCAIFRDLWVSSSFCVVVNIFIGKFIQVRAVSFNTIVRLWWQLTKPFTTLFPKASLYFLPKCWMHTIIGIWCKCNTTLYYTRFLNASLKYLPKGQEKQERIWDVRFSETSGSRFFFDLYILIWFFFRLVLVWMHTSICLWFKFNTTLYFIRFLNASLNFLPKEQVKYEKNRDVRFSEISGSRLLFDLYILIWFFFDWYTFECIK